MRKQKESKKSKQLIFIRVALKYCTIDLLMIIFNRQTINKKKRYYFRITLATLKILSHIWVSKNWREKKEIFQLSIAKIPVSFKFSDILKVFHCPPKSIIYTLTLILMKLYYILYNDWFEFSFDIMIDWNEPCPVQNSLRTSHVIKAISRVENFVKTFTLNQKLK